MKCSTLNINLTNSQHDKRRMKNTKIKYGTESALNEWFAKSSQI